MDPDKSDKPGKPEKQDNPGKPVFRKLRAFVLDPSQSVDLDGADANEMVVAIPWEELACGPSGEYVAVVNRDHTGRELGTALNLDDPLILARGSLAPSDGDFLFHQQMVYAVAMRTIRLFEKALGRQVQWQPPGGEYAGQLKLYPHYEPSKSAQFQPGVGITFGYIGGSPGSASHGVNVFTCLSQDVIAHLVCHAIVCPHFAYEAEADNPDRLAFHEGFCDLVAVLQRCTQPEFVRRQLTHTRGELTGASQLGILAAQVGEAVGQVSGLRSAFGEFDAAGAWQPRTPNRTDYAEYRKDGEAHHLGSLLFAAVFHCLDGIYRTRVADLLRIATDGTGILPPGDLHPDLIARLTNELAISASHVLNMCIRALDYLPAVGITFGDYLRAVLTADHDLVPDDSFNYRLAFAAGFRRFGIYPAGIGTLSVDTLLWPRVPADSPTARLVQPFIKEVCNQYTAWSLPRDRKKQFDLVSEWCTKLQHYFKAGKLDAHLLPGIQPRSPYTIRSIWLSERAVPPGPTRSCWVIEIEQHGAETVTNLKLLVDAETELVQYAIHKTVCLQESAHKGRTLQLVNTPPLAPSLGAPLVRPLQVFTFDPSLELQLDTAHISKVTLDVPWEKLSPGPVGEYLEIIDYDPASGCCYAPVNLDDTYLLAQAGYAPTQALPQFHQQMVYAVAMRTIHNFEHALGRLALWAPRHSETKLRKGKVKYQDEYVPQLRIYPHALREANAYYSPEKKSVLFGYFQSTVESATNPVTVFTCLSHDIIAHEMTHALLDGMHGRFAEPSNADALAFHEAFADIVALFQHFSLPEALAHQIANTRGDLASQNRLGELAQEFGSAIGNRGALRSAIGQVDDKTGEWRPREPDPRAYGTLTEPHARGSLLVAAVFDAFLTIYRARVADLLRIATRGTGVLPSGQLHPDLVQRLAREAAASAQDVLEMCIRALDYCPPVDLTFGDYLRAIVTADREYNPADEQHRRVAFVEAFRRQGILPAGVRTFALEGLYWPPDEPLTEEAGTLVRRYVQTWTADIVSWNLSRDRKALYDLMVKMRGNLQRFLNKPQIRPNLEFAVPYLPFEVHALRPAMRTDLLGKQHFHWIIELTQWLPDFFDEKRAEEFDRALKHAPEEERLAVRARAAAAADYPFRGGTTLIVDVESGGVLYSIKKPIDDQRRRCRQRQYRAEAATQSLYATYFGPGGTQEPFAALHRF